MKTTKFIPNRKDFQTHEQWDAHVQAYQMIHEMQDQIRSLQAQLSQKSDIGRKYPSPKATAPESPVNSHINGFYVKAGSPANGNTIRFNSTSQQFEFGT